MTEPAEIVIWIEPEACGAAGGDPKRLIGMALRGRWGQMGIKASPDWKRWWCFKAKECQFGNYLSPCINFVNGWDCSRSSSVLASSDPSLRALRYTAPSLRDRSNCRRTFALFVPIPVLNRSFSRTILRSIIVFFFRYP